LAIISCRLHVAQCVLLGADDERSVMADTGAQSNEKYIEGKVDIHFRVTPV